VGWFESKTQHACVGKKGEMEERRGAVGLERLRIFFSDAKEGREDRKEGKDEKKGNAV